MFDVVIEALQFLNQLVTAGIAITGFSLLLYALTFNLRDRVARSFALILVCMVIVYVGDAISTIASSNSTIELWLKLEWIGIAFLPACYLHFSDALLATTGRPSRGRRRLAVRLMYLVGLLFLITLVIPLAGSSLVGSSQGSCPFGSIYLVGLLNEYSKRSNDCAFWGSGIMVSAWANLPSRASYHLAL
mgnify:CR=1 FL=1